MTQENRSKPTETRGRGFALKTVFLLFGFLTAATYCFSQEATSEKTKVPHFTLKDSEGNTFSSEVLEGKIVVLDFWATWCAPCLRAIPELKKAEAKFAEDKEVVFLFVNTLEPKNRDMELIKDFLIKKKIDLYFLMDIKNSEDSERTLTDNLNISGLPTTIVMDSAGYIAFRSSGFAGNSDAILEKLEPIIASLKLK